MALRRQQAQEENEARELGILFPTPANLSSHNEQVSNNCYLSGASSSSPNDSTEVKNYSENESGSLLLKL